MFSKQFTTRTLVLLAAGWLVVQTGWSTVDAAGSSPQASSGTADASSSQALVTRYCTGCHNRRLLTGGLALDMEDLAKVGESPDVWEKVIRKLRLGSMPPVGLPRPDKPAADTFVAFLKNELDRAAVQHPNPGRVETFHRLNRVEYQNAIRDLLAIDIDVASLLPADDSDKHGFDNVASTLSVSPMLLERYISAAKKISRLAMGVAPAGADTATYTGISREVDDDRLNASEDLPFGSRGGLAVHHYFPVDGGYVTSVRLRRSGYDYIMGLGDSHQLDVRVDGELVKSFTVGGEAPGRSAPVSYSGYVVGDPAWEEYMLRLDAGLRVRFPAKAGPHVIGVSFVARPTEDEGIKQPPDRVTAGSLTNEFYYSNPSVESVSIEGPFAAIAASDSPSRRKVLSCDPTARKDEESCARKVLSTLARRAYRRPVTATEVETLLTFYRSGRQGHGFDAGIQHALERVLVDPNFLFRIERDPANVRPATGYPVSNLELASRLSFFLWSSIPDDELLDVAVRGTLREPGVLARQTRRMFADPRSKALVTNFIGQWLQLRDIAHVKPDGRQFPDFDETLREAFRQETELFVESTMREDRSLIELLTANYTFVNERLARHYQIPNVHGERFRRVALGDDTQRGGLLAHGSLLTLTSYPTRTSPVLRGKWLLDNILGAPPPPPPPNVPGLPERGEGNKPASVRERLERHRKNPVCATCHAQMDPLGFALESYDAIGRWRTKTEAGSPVDDTGAFVNGVKFQGLSGLRTFLLSNQEAFVESVIGKLLAYALGRGLEVYDLPTVRAIQRAAAANDHRWSSVILGIVGSPAFQMRRSPTDGVSTVEGIPESQVQP